MVLKFQEDSFCSGNYFRISLDYPKMKYADFFFRNITYDLVRYLTHTASDFMKFRALLSGIRLLKKLPKKLK